MSLVYGKMWKRPQKEQNLELKYKTLLELEKDKTNKEVAQLFGKRIHIKSVRLFRKGSATTKTVKVDTYDQVNKAVLKGLKG